MLLWFNYCYITVHWTPQYIELWFKISLQYIDILKKCWTTVMYLTPLYCRGVYFCWQCLHYYTDKSYPSPECGVYFFWQCLHLLHRYILPIPWLWGLFLLTVHTFITQIYLTHPLIVGSIPASRRRNTISSWPRSHAQCKAVQRFYKYREGA